MTNPAGAIKLLITYAVCIPLACLVGYLLTDPMDYGTLGIFGVIALLLVSPLLIKWHYPFMVFALASPVYCFFLKGSPPLGQVAVLLSFGIAIVDRAMNSDKRFISPSVMTWPFLYTAAMAYMTAELTGGIGLKALGGEVAGGKKYIALFIGVATFFALTSRVIPREKRNFYIALYFLPGVLQVFSDLFPYLPAPLNYINLLIPPSAGPTDEVGGGFGVNMARFGAFASAAGVVATFLLAKYGLRGVFRFDQPLRALLFLVMFTLTLFGGFRIILVSFVMLGTALFFLEGLHRTKMLPLAFMVGILFLSLLVPFARQLPFTFQRALTVVPMLKLSPEAVMDADGSKQWRLDIWRDTWPKVPRYLLLGKGYALTAEDFQMMGTGTFAGKDAQNLDKSETPLAISMDYHNGPLSTLMPFGVWGALSFFWIALAGLWVTYRNFRYSDPELKTFNTFLLATMILHVVGFFVLFGSFAYDVGDFAKVAGFSVALNWGVRAPKPRPVSTAHIKPLKTLPRPQPLPA